MLATNISHAAHSVPIDALHNPIKALKQHTTILLLLIMMIALSFAACGRRDESYDTGTHAYDEPGPRPGETTAGDASIHDTYQTMPELLIDRSAFYGETLTIFVLNRHNNDIAAIADEYMRQNPGVTIDIIAFGNNLERARQETIIALGDIALPAEAPPATPPVLIESALVNPSDTHHFVNWTPFIDATPSFNDYNFFMNAINAMTVDGYLYEFPLRFMFNIVATSNSIPGLTQAMEMYEGGITMYRLLELARSFNHSGYHPDPERSHQLMYLMHNFDVGQGFTYLHDSFDTEAGIANFNNQRFTSFLDNARQLTYPEKVFGEDIALSIGALNPSITFFMWRYFFINIATCNNRGILHWTTNLRDRFTGATPIISNQGELIITPSATYVLSTHATQVQQDLAWDFMQFMASEEGARAAYRSLRSRIAGSSGWVAGMYRELLPLIPTNREAARFTVRADWPATGLNCNLTFMLTGTTYSDIAIPIMEYWLDDVADTPMVLAQAMSDAVNLLLYDFHNGAISAVETAMLIQDLTEFDVVRTEE